MLKKRWLVSLFLLWILAVGQLAQGHEQEEEKVAGVFARIGEQEQTGAVEYYGVYKKEFLESEDQEKFLRHIAGGLGITENIEVTRRYDENREETRLTKEGSNAKSVLRFITADVEGEISQYVIINITMEGDMVDAYAYREKLESLMEPYGKNSKSSANIIGSYQGKLSLEERNAVADDFLESMNARVVSENREMQLYTIYGYTPWIFDYEMHEGEPFNVNIAMHYSTNDDKTYVYVAVPAVGLDSVTVKP